MTDINSITPSPELIEQWRCEPQYITAEQAGRCLKMVSMTYDRFMELMQRSAKYGAAQRLEACSKWLEEDLYEFAIAASAPHLTSDLRDANSAKELPTDDPYLESCSKAVLDRARQIDEMMGVNVYGPHEPDTCASSWVASKLIASLEERISTLESLSN